jgi:Tfp pilus assembly protein PilF
MLVPLAQEIQDHDDRKPGSHEGQKLLVEHQERPPADAAASDAWKPTPGQRASLRLGIEHEQPFGLQAAARRLGAFRFDL